MQSQVRSTGISKREVARETLLPYFNIQRQLSLALDNRGLTYRHGIIHTTNYRLWEFDADFRAAPLAERAKVIDMECDSFQCGFFAKT